MSMSSSGERTDLHPIFRGMPPLPLFVHTYPRCGFSGWLADHREPKEIPDELKRKILGELGPLVRNAAPDGGRHYEFAAFIAEWQGKSANEIVWIYLQATWCCVDEGDSTRQRDRERVTDSRHVRGLIDHFCAVDSSNATVFPFVGLLRSRCLC